MMGTGTKPIWFIAYHYLHDDSRYDCHLVHKLLLLTYNLLYTTKKYFPAKLYKKLYCSKCIGFDLFFYQVIETIGSTVISSAIKSLSRTCLYWTNQKAYFICSCKLKTVPLHNINNEHWSYWHMFSVSYQHAFNYQSCHYMSNKISFIRKVCK